VEFIDIDVKMISEHTGTRVRLYARLFTMTIIRRMQ